MCLALFILVLLLKLGDVAAFGAFAFARASHYLLLICGVVVG